MLEDDMRWDHVSEMVNKEFTLSPLQLQDLARKAMRNSQPGFYDRCKDRLIDFINRFHRIPKAKPSCDLKEVYISPEAAEDIKNWRIDEDDKGTLTIYRSDQGV